MTNIQSEDDFIARCFASVDADILFDMDIQTATTATLITGQTTAVSLNSAKFTLPSLPSGVTAYIPTMISDCYSSVLHTLYVCKIVHFGVLDISTNVYTADATMPTYTEGNNSNVTYSGVFASVNTALNATPGTLVITYTNQAGTTSVSSPSATLTASAATNTASATAGLIPLATTDYGVQAVTGAVRSGGTTPTGKLDFWGTIPITIVNAGLIANCAAYKPLHFNGQRLAAGDVIQTFSMGSAAIRRITMNLRLVGDK